jgi:hypothetical protein
LVVGGWVAAHASPLTINDRMLDDIVTRFGVSIPTTNHQPPTTVSAMNPFRWSPWAWMPFVIIGITIIPNTILIVGARRVGISKVEPRPWTAAERLDGDKTRRAAFAASGRVFAVTVEGAALTCTLSGGPAVAGAVVRAYRPSAAALDQRWPWADPGQPLRATLPAPGRWVIHLDLPDLPAAATHAVEALP